MYNHNKAQQSKNRVHISWDILYVIEDIELACHPQLSNINGYAEMQSQVHQYLFRNYSK